MNPSSAWQNTILQCNNSFALIEQNVPYVRCNNYWEWCGMVVKHVSFFLVSRHECGNTLCHNLIDFNRTFPFQKTIVPFNKFPPTKEIPIHTRNHIQRNMVEAPTASCIVAQNMTLLVAICQQFCVPSTNWFRRYGRSLCLVTFACNFVRANIFA